MANYTIYAGVMGTKPTVDLKAIAKLKSKDEIVAALMDSFAVAHQAIATITPANQTKPRAEASPRRRSQSTVRCMAMTTTARWWNICA